MNVLVVGIDYSTTAEFWSFICDTKVVSLVKLAYPKNHDFALRYAMVFEDEVTTRTCLFGATSGISFASADWIGVEGYMSRFDREGKMAAIHWMIRAKAAREGNFHMVIPSTQWKKALGINGRADKEEVKQRVLEFYPELPKDLPQDAYDATGIARCAYRIAVLDEAKNVAE